MELRSKNKLTVIPIFYGVDPSDMRKEKGHFLKPLSRHRRRPFVDNVPKWKEALNEISYVIGKDPRKFDDDDAMIKVIVRDISTRLSSMVPMDLGGMVGMIPHMERLDHRLNIESEDDDVRMIGIWGMGGVGKSTIAKYFFNRHSCRFSARCFIEDVGKLARAFSLVGLQERLISYILLEDIKLSTIEHGRHHIKSALGHQRVLIVLDGVDTVDQIRALRGEERSIFGKGSRIIITTRDKRLLRTCGFMERDLYEVNCLEKDDSLLMFKGVAFDGGIPPSNAHERLSIKASQLAHGLPSALRAFGLCFHEMTTIAEWKNQLGRLETTPPHKTIKIFENSYMSLSKIEKDVFLYVACLFNGDSVLRVEALFEDFAYVIQVLSDMSLINISTDGYLKMHVLIEQMGKQLVRQESRQRPEKQQILWDTRDICNVLQHQSGSNQIQCLALHVCEVNRKLDISSRNFNSMYRLKLLKFYKHLDDDIESKLQFDSENHIECTYLDLSLLHWDAYPSTTLPLNLELESLVELNLRYSNLESLWVGKPELRNLRRIDVTGSKNLKQFPDISKAIELEELLMDCCSKLERFPGYIGSLYNLRKLHATHCDHLMSLEIRVSTRTEELSASSCPRILLEFPNEEKPLQSLANLSIDGKITFCLEQLKGDADHFSFNSEKHISYKLMMRPRPPFVLSRLHNFKYLEIKRSKYKEDDPPFRCHGFSDFPLLTELNLINLKINNIPSCIGELQSLETLNLSGNDFKNLPQTMEQLSNLKYLDLHNCCKLEALPTLTQVETLILSDCISLISLLKLSTPQVDQGRYRLLELELDNCNNIQSLSQQLSHFTNLKELKLNRHSFVTAPESIKELSLLTTLSLNNCNNLESLEELPLSLKCLYAHGCFKLETVSVSPDHFFEDVDLDHCSHLKLDDHLINRFPSDKRSAKVTPECGFC